MFRISWLAYFNNSILSASYRFIRRNPRIWIWIAKHYHPFLTRVAHFNACLICDWATYKVPAYKQFLQENGAKFNFWDFDLTQYSETKKSNYSKVYAFKDRVKFGHFDLVGLTIDESSGSTGTPFNWIRSTNELRDVHSISANYMRLEFPTEKIITLNAFSMGSWATGLNMTYSLLKIGAVKSIGPDIDKIIDTLQLFGPDYNYIICGYPPFLKHLLDEMETRKFNFTDYNLYAIVGGEGMTEALRDYLETGFKIVRSGYGATDIQLGIGGESNFSVWLRKEMLNNNQLKEAILGNSDSRLPMLFHYNPLDHFIEINPDGEVIITINNFHVIMPRVRYNIEDEGKILEFEKVLEVLAQQGYDASELKQKFAEDWVKLPILAMFGRKDGTISYMGANIYPQDVEYGLYSGAQGKQINNFFLTLNERADLEVRPCLHIELIKDKELSVEQEAELKEQIVTSLVDYLSKVDRDFKESLQEDATAKEIQIKFYQFGNPLFYNKKIKNSYLRQDGGKVA